MRRQRHVIKVLKSLLWLAIDMKIEREEMELKCETCSHVTCTYAKKVEKKKKKPGVEQIIPTKKPGLYSWGEIIWEERRDWSKDCRSSDVEWSSHVTFLWSIHGKVVDQTKKCDDRKSQEWTLLKVWSSLRVNNSGMECTLKIYIWNILLTNNNKKFLLWSLFWWEYIYQRL